MFSRNVSKAQCRTENWTQLNCSVSSCVLNRRRSATIRRRNWRSSQVLHNRSTFSWIGQSMQCLSFDENRRRAATAVAGSSLSRTCDATARRRSSQLVADSTHSGKLNWTELNCTELNDLVQDSFPLCIPMHSRYTFTNIVKSYKDRLPKPISLNFTMPLLPALRAVLSCCLHCAQCEICLLHLLLPSSMCAWACLFSFVLVDSIGELLLWYCCWVFLTYVLSMSIFFLIKISADSEKNNISQLQN